MTNEKTKKQVGMLSEEELVTLKTQLEDILYNRCEFDEVELSPEILEILKGNEVMLEDLYEYLAGKPTWEIVGPVYNPGYNYEHPTESDLKEVADLVYWIFTFFYDEIAKLEEGNEAEFEEFDDCGFDFDRLVDRVYKCMTNKENYKSRIGNVEFAEQVNNLIKNIRRDYIAAREDLELYEVKCINLYNCENALKSYLAEIIRTLTQ